MKNREARNAHIRSQFPAGGNLLPRNQIAAQDCLSVSVVHLAVERLCFVTIDCEYRAERGSDVTHQQYDLTGHIFVI